MEFVLKNVCLFGDSIAKGVSFDDLSGRYTILKNNFAALTADTLGVILSNKAKFGCTIRKGQEVISRIISSKPDDAPIDFALLEFGGNDCDFNWKEIAMDPDAVHLPNTPIPEFVEIYEEIIRDLESNQIVPVIMTLPPLVADSYFKWFSKDIPQKENIIKWLGGDVEAIYYWHERYNSAVWEVATHMNCRIIDIRKAFLEQKNHRRFICTDGIHLNQAGNDLVYSVLLRSAEAYSI
ncbi:MAG: SGNH/GDSL hydrolase family protein [Saccharofermentanales bacterium]